MQDMFFGKNLDLKFIFWRSIFFSVSYIQGRFTLKAKNSFENRSLVFF